MSSHRWRSNHFYVFEFLRKGQLQNAVNFFGTPRKTFNCRLKSLMTQILQVYGCNKISKDSVSRKTRVFFFEKRTVPVQRYLYHQCSNCCHEETSAFEDFECYVSAETKITTGKEMLLSIFLLVHKHNKVVISHRIFEMVIEVK